MVFDYPKFGFLIIARLNVNHLVVDPARGLWRNGAFQGRYGISDAIFLSKLMFMFIMGLISSSPSCLHVLLLQPTPLLCRLIIKAFFVLAPMRIGQMPSSMEADYPKGLPNADFFISGSAPRLRIMNYASLSICRLWQRVAWHEDESECRDSQQGAEILARVYSV